MNDTKNGAGAAAGAGTEVSSRTATNAAGVADLGGSGGVADAGAAALEGAAGSGAASVLDGATDLGTPTELGAVTNLSGAASSGAGVSSAAGDEASSGSAAGSGRRYVKPSRSTNVFNEIVAFLTRRGVSVWGSRVLHVRGRKTGEVRTVPVNLLTHDGVRYLVAPRGHTQWVRNLRAAGEGELRVGRRVERFRPTELADDAKPAILRAYLRRWKFEVGVFFDGVDANASEADLLRIAPGYPVFRITTAP